MSTEKELQDRLVESLKKVQISKKWAVEWDEYLLKLWHKIFRRKEK